MDDHDKNFITGIHNYCDRWCERCGFTSRCTVFAIEQEYTEEETNPESDAFWQKLKNIFAKTKEILLQTAEERGIDLSAADEKEVGRELRAREEVVYSQDLLKMAESYAKKAHPTLEKLEPLLIEIDEETRNEMLSIIYWYQFLIAAKIFRGLDAEYDEDDEDFAEISEQDKNGSIKVALISIDRSIMAWSGLLTKNTLAQIKLIINLLEKIRANCEQKFPNARDFLRPGFDEIETVM
jgi:hypothetical protein